MTTTPTPRTCLVPNCDREVQPRYLMCGPHFKQLPHELADSLYFAWVLANKPQHLGQQQHAQRGFERVKQRALDHISPTPQPHQPTE